MRVSDVEVLGVDNSGFVLRPARDEKPSASVPARTKDRLVVELAGKDLKTVRVWGKDLATPAAAK